MKISRVCARTVRIMIGQYRFIFVLRVVIVRISHAMCARHAGFYASPFATDAGCLQHPDAVGILDW
jgi:hypothetical protein